MTGYIGRLALLSCVFAIGAFAGEVNKRPINPAEVILDLRRQGFETEILTQHTTFKHGFFTEFSATGKLEEKAKVQLVKNFDDFSCEGYDTLIFFVSQFFRAQTVTMVVTTDAGIFENTEVSEPRGTSESNFMYMELMVNLGESKQIKQIKIIFEADKPGRGRWPNYWQFLALRDTNRFNDYLEYWDEMRNVHWHKYTINPGSFEDAASLTFAEGELELYREYVKEKLPEYEQIIARQIEQAKQYCDSIGEADIGIVNRRMHQREPFGTFPGNLALYSVLCENAEGLRWAARSALAQASFETWRRQPFRANWRFSASHIFNVSYKSHSLSKATSLSASALNRQGREYVLYGLLDKGYKEGLHSLWGRPAFTSNQGALFLQSKILPLLLFEQYWPRVKPYTEIAMNELNEVADYMFRTDGGYLESMGYMNMTISVLIPSYMGYRAVRNLPVNEIIPEGIKNSANFAELVYSTSKHPSRNVVSFGQTVQLSFSATRPTLFMAAICPGTIWERFVDMAALEEETLDPEMWRLTRQVEITGEYPPLTPFVEVPSVGCVNSYRETESGGMSKILFMGFSRMGKREQDIGKFIIEYDGDAFADAMTGRMAPYYATAEFQNMLVPTGTPASAHPVPYTTIARDDMKFIPEARGDEKSFHAVIDNLGESWDAELLKKWSRTIDSPNPETVIITDEYELGDAADGVDFTWITTLPAELEGDKIVVTGDYGSICELTWNDGCTASVERFKPSAAVYNGMFIDREREFSRIKIHRAEKQGRIIVEAKFIPSL